MVLAMLLSSVGLLVAMGSSLVVHSRSSSRE